jgi:hypothetical protein
MKSRPPILLRKTALEATVGNDPTVGRSGLGGLPGPDRSFRNGRSILIRANTRVGKGARTMICIVDRSSIARAVPTRSSGVRSGHVGYSLYRRHG